jgi:putative transposase
VKAAVKELALHIGVAATCEALSVPRSTAQRWRRPPLHGPRRPRPTPPRALSEPERTKVLEVLRSERFVDKAPATIHATLLDEDEYLLPRTHNVPNF